MKTGDTIYHRTLPDEPLRVAEIYRAGTLLYAEVRRSDGVRLWGVVDRRERFLTQTEKKGGN